MPLEDKETGWICPVCGSGVAPSVKEHCKKSKKGGVELPIPSSPAYPGPSSYCNLCHQTYYGWSHACYRWSPTSIRPVKDYPYRVTCSSTTASTGPLPKDDQTDLSVFDFLRDLENMWPSCAHDKSARDIRCSNCPPDAGQPAYAKVPQKTM